MFLLKEPTPETAKRYMEERVSAEVAYNPLLHTSFPERVKGYVNDDNVAVIGQGEECFEKAREAVRSWRVFPDSWAKVYVSEVAQKVGTVVGVVLKHLGFYSINPSRVVYVVDEKTKAGFAYGTLPGHAERGEELFQVEWDKESDNVSYRIRAYSRPGHLLSLLGYPVVRALQKRFVRDSIAQMKEICSKGETERS